MARPILTHTIISIVYSRGCISYEELLNELKNHGVDVDIDVFKAVLWQLKKKGKLSSPSRGVYCRPSDESSRH